MAKSTLPIPTDATGLAYGQRVHITKGRYAGRQGDVIAVTPACVTVLVESRSHFGNHDFQVLLGHGELEAER